MAAMVATVCNTIDIMIVGNFLGDSSLAAIGASSSIYELLLGFCFGVGNGLSIVVSRYFGQGDKTLLKKSGNLFKPLKNKIISDMLLVYALIWMLITLVLVNDLPRNLFELAPEF